jgi:alpha-tubulin suppressor-like RCC1 family protein
MRKTDLSLWLVAALLGPGAGLSTAADPTLAGGLYHSLAVDSAGRVLSWGEDGSGQLGSGRATFVSTPTLIKDMPTGTVAALAGGVFHSLALMDDGRVLAWGNNAEGVLGDGSTQSHSSPLPVLGLPGMRRIHSGERHAMGTDAQGRVWSWGLNHMGQLGHSSSAYQSNVPQQVSLADVLDARGGAAHTVALTGTGEVWTWGDNRMGQLGTSTPSQSGTPVRVSFPVGTPRITAIDAAGDQSYAIDNDGGLWAWGDNRYRQLADGTVSQRSSPARISALIGVTAVSAGRVGAAAITSDGAVWIWGGYEAVATPAKLNTLSGTASAVRMGEYHLLVTRADGSLVAIGGNFNGQLGDGSTTTPSSGVLKTPLGVNGPVRQIGTGNKHALAVDSSGRLWSWGDDLKGQTGSATETTRNIPAWLRTWPPAARWRRATATPLPCCAMGRCTPGATTLEVRLAVAQLACAPPRRQWWDWWVFGTSVRPRPAVRPSTQPARCGPGATTAADSLRGRCPKARLTDPPKLRMCPHYPKWRSAVGTAWVWMAQASCGPGVTTAKGNWALAPVRSAAPRHKPLPQCRTCAP